MLRCRGFLSIFLGSVLLFHANLAKADWVGDLYQAWTQKDSQKALKIASNIRDGIKSGKVSASTIGNLEAQFPLGAQDSGTVFYYAAREGWENVVLVLLECGVVVDSKNGKFESTPLQSAAHRKFSGIVTALLQAGAKVGIKNNAGNSVLHSAVRDDSPVLDELLSAATLEDLKVKDSKKYTPYTLALNLGKNATAGKLKARYDYLTGLSNSQAQSSVQSKGQSKHCLSLLGKINSAADPKATYLLDEVSIERLTPSELVDVMVASCAKRSASAFAAKLCFESRDWMIRLSENDQGKLAYFKSQVSNDPVIHALDFSKSHFHTVDLSKAKKGSMSGARIQMDSSYKNQNPKLLVLHASVSYHGKSTGGMGVYLDSFIHSQEKHRDQSGVLDMEGRELNPFYEILKRELFGPEAFQKGKDFFGEIKFDGLIEHEADGKIYKSSVYELTTQGIRQYLVQPDPSYVANAHQRGSDMMTNGTYATFRDDTGFVYFSGAFSAFAVFYQGENKSENIDVLMAHDRRTAMVSANMYLKYNSLRVSAGLPTIPVVGVIHNQSGLNDDINSSNFSRSGLPLPGRASSELFVIHSLYSDYTLAVSKAYSLELAQTNPDLRLGNHFSSFRSANLFDGISNGIDAANFSVFDTKKLGSVAVSQDFSDYELKKNSAKDLLFKAGLIGDSQRPLFLYVGRYHNQKGIDLLPAMAAFVINRGGQMVVMGPGDGDGEPPIAELKRMVRDQKYQGLLKVYTDVPRDQLAPLASAGPETKRGHLLRFAADFTVVPSVTEAGGLVPIEAFAMGSGVITSNASGIQDVCKPLNKVGIDGKYYDISNFSCMTFKRHYDIDPSKRRIKDEIKQMKTEVAQQLDLWSQLRPDEQLAARKRWVNESSEFNWNFLGGSMDRYKAVFDLIRTGLSSDQMDARRDAAKRYSLPF